MSKRNFAHDKSPLGNPYSFTVSGQYYCYLRVAGNCNSPLEADKSEYGD